MKRKDADEALEIARDGEDEDDEDMNENEELRSRGRRPGLPRLRLKSGLDTPDNDYLMGAPQGTVIK